MTLSLQVAFSAQVITPEQEKELARRAFEEQCPKAIEQLVSSHMPLAASIAKRYSGYQLPLDDLFQEACIGLMKAARKFDPSIGVRFATYAQHQMKSEIGNYVLDNVRAFRIATTAAHRKLFYRLRAYRTHEGSFSDAEVDRICSDLNVSPSDVREMELKLFGYDVSVHTTAEEEDDYSLESLLRDDCDPSVAVEAERWEINVLGRMESSIKALDDRSRDIIYSRWVEEEKKTLHELAAKHKCSHERVRQLEKKALESIKNNMQIAA